MNTKGWDLLGQLLTTTSLGRAELLMCSHMWALARLLGLGPITLSPHSLIAASTSLSLDFGQEIFWSLLMKPSEGSRTSLSWARASTGLTLQSLHPQFTVSLRPYCHQEMWSCLLPALAACFFLLPCASTTCGAATSHLDQFGGSFFSQISRLTCLTMWFHSC